MTIFRGFYKLKLLHKDDSGKIWDIPCKWKYLNEYNFCSERIDFYFINENLEVLGLWDENYKDNRKENDCEINDVSRIVITENQHKQIYLLNLDSDHQSCFNWIRNNKNILKQKIEELK